MKVKNFSAPMIFLLAIMLVASIIVLLPVIAVVAKPVGPNPEMWWPSGTIWGTGLSLENGAYAGVAWFGAKTGSTVKLLAPPAGVDYMRAVFVDGATQYFTVDYQQVAAPQSYSWYVKLDRSGAASANGTISCEFENAEAWFVPPDFSVVLDNSAQGIFVNLREENGYITGLPKYATLYVDNAVNVSISPSYQEGTVGENLTYTVTVQNTGRYNDNYSLSASDNLGWGISLDNDLLQIPAGENRTTTLHVVIENYAANLVTVTADGVYASDSDRTTATVPPRAVELIVEPGYQSAEPYNWLEYTVTVRNVGRLSDNYDLGVTDDLGWGDNIYLDNENLENIRPGENKQTILHVHVPYCVEGGTEDNITITATSQENAEVSDNDSCLAHVDIIRGVEISILPNYDNGVPYTTLDYTVTVKNTGNVDDTYDISVSDNAGWGDNIWLDDESLLVGRCGKENTTTLHVYVPYCVEGGTEDNITVTATSKADNTVENSASCIAHVAIIRGVEVSISPSYQGGLPTDMLNYTVTVKNRGNVPDHYDLNVSDNAGWNPVLSDNLLENVGLCEDNQVTLSVVIPENAEYCTRDNITVTATSQADNTVSDNDSCIAHAGIVKRVDVSISPSYNSGLPEENLTYEVIVTNMSNAEDNYNLTVSDSADPSWGPKLSENRLDNVQPSENRIIILNVIVPGDVAGCTVDNIRVTATSMENEEVENSENCQAHALIVRFVEVSISPSYQSGVRGSTVSYTVTVKNMGNVEDNYNLAVGDNASWNPTLDNAWIVIPRNDYRTTILSVTIPENAVGCTEDNIIVTTTSQADNTVENSVSCIAHALEARTEIKTLIYPGADIYAFGEYTKGYSRSQLKFDISSIPSGAGIISAKLWLYRSAADSWDGNVALYRIENQVWDETITASEFDSQTLTDGENHADKFMSHGWDNLDVLTQLKVDYDAAHTFTSFRLRWVNDNESEPSVGVDDGRFLLINGEAEELSIVFCASEYNGRNPYLEIIYVPPYAVSISISPTYISESPGENVIFLVAVTNTGNLDDNYSLTVSDNTGWGPSVSTPVISVASGSSGEATLTVTIPENAIGCTRDNITVTATSQTDNTVSDNDSCIAHVEVVRGVDISISPKYKENLHGGKLNYAVIVTNTGNVDDNYDLTVDDNESWGLSIASSITVPAFENRTTMLTVTIPENAIGCTRDNITVTATSQTDNTVSDNDSCIAHVEVVRSVDISISPAENSGPPEETLTYIVTVTNTGNVPDNYSLENSDNMGWVLSLDNDLLTIPVGENRTTKLSVTIPKNAENCTRDNVTVTATSQENAQISDNASCIAHVVVIVKEFTLQLVAGWNLVGFPLTSESTTPNNIFTGLNYYENYYIYYWDAPGGPYGTQDPDEVLEDNLGYWVWIDQDYMVTTKGTPRDNREVYLIAGWNLVSFPVVNENTTPNNIFTGLNYYTDCYLYYYTPPGGPYGLQDPDKVLENDLGYWAWINQDKTVTVP